MIRPARTECGGGDYDSVYVAPHIDDVALSCAGSVIEDRSRRRRVLVVTIFDGPHDERLGEEERAASEIGFDWLPAGFVDAPYRSPCYRRPVDLVFCNADREGELILRVADSIEAVLRRCAPRRVYLPLGVGGHVDHRVCHAAGRRAVSSLTRTRPLFYEDRPYAFVGGALGLRLGALGMRPVGSARDLTGRWRMMLRYLRDGVGTGYAARLLRPRDLVACVRGTAGLVRDAGRRPTTCTRSVVRGWSREVLEPVERWLSLYRSQFPDPLGTVGALMHRAALYTRGIGADGAYGERLWRLSSLGCSEDA